MPTPDEPFAPAIRTIFHPSDFSPASQVAFAHALRIALMAKADLNILHVSSDIANANWTHFPGVRATLERWEMIPEGRGKEAVADLGIGVRKVMAAHVDPVQSALEFLRQHPADLIVLATHSTTRLARWFKKSIAEPIARRASGISLFIPYGVSGFVSLENGDISLKNILAPVDGGPRAQPVIEAAHRMAVALGLEDITLTVVYTGQDGGLPALALPRKEGWTWNDTALQGNPAGGVLEAARKTAADMIVMTRTGRRGFLDAVCGSTAERVLHGAPCPLAVIPES